LKSKKETEQHTKKKEKTYQDPIKGVIEAVGESGKVKEKKEEKQVPGKETKGRGKTVCIEEKYAPVSGGGISKVPCHNKRHWGITNRSFGGQRGIRGGGWESEAQPW